MADHADQPGSDPDLPRLFGDRPVPCDSCGYDLSRCTTLRCPECGRRVLLSHVLDVTPLSLPPSRTNTVLFTVGGLGTLGSLMWFWPFGLYAFLPIGISLLIFGVGLVRLAYDAHLPAQARRLGFRVRNLGEVPQPLTDATGALATATGAEVSMLQCAADASSDAMMAQLLLTTGGLGITWDVGLLLFPGRPPRADVIVYGPEELVPHGTGPEAFVRFLTHEAHRFLRPDICWLDGGSWIGAARIPPAEVTDYEQLLELVGVFRDAVRRDLERQFSEPAG